MAKVELKNKPQRQSVAAFLNAVDNEQRRKDAKAVDRMMREVTGKKPVMWGGSIVGYGSYHYVYDSGREGDWMMTGFSPRKANLVVHIMLDLKILHRLIAESVESMRRKYQCA